MWNVCVCVAALDLRRTSHYKSGAHRQIAKHTYERARVCAWMRKQTTYFYCILSLIASLWLPYQLTVFGNTHVISLIYKWQRHFWHWFIRKKTHSNKVIRRRSLIKFDLVRPKICVRQLSKWKKWTSNRKFIQTKKKKKAQRKVMCTAHLSFLAIFL